MLFALLGEALKKAEEAELKEELFKAVMELRSQIDYVRKKLDQVVEQFGTTYDPEKRLSELVRQLLESGMTLEEIRRRYSVFGKDPFSPLTDEERRLVVAKMERDLAERRQAQVEAEGATEEERQPAVVPVPAPAPGGGGGRKKKPVVVLVPTP
ncbi:MAG: hypothetical protein QW650_01195 [Thermofilum sp.]